MSFRYRPPRRPPVRSAPPTLPFGASGPEASAIPVSLFVAKLNGVLRASLPETWVKGEIGEWKVWSSGHAYFTLKDASAALPAVMWASDLARVPFRPEEGMEVLARGRPDVYPRNGRLSFVVGELQPVGAGALQLAFEQLKARLAAEGLFEPARKKRLPLLPRRIGVVTSRHGAAVRDVLKVLSARFPNAHVTVWPVAVQGASAPEEIAGAVDGFSRHGAADVVIVARGGGSRDDLSAFNDERVVRAVAASRIPTISAVGHEVDVTLTDLAADLRAATPSQAAELVVARRDDFEARIVGLGRELARTVKGRLLAAHADAARLVNAPALAGVPARAGTLALRASAAARDLLSAVKRLPAAFRERLLRAEGAMASWPARAALPLGLARAAAGERAAAESLSRRLGASRERLGALAATLSALDPLRVLARGYSVTYLEGATAPLVDAEDAAPGDALRIVLARGSVRARVTDTSKDGAR
jgi:exodeoxyribonuclease VII large subunit